MNLRGFSRRLTDVIVSLAALAVLTPFLAVIALFVLMSDGRPIVFRQSRVGKDGKPFRILKFRTMNGSTAAPAITAAGDPRVTELGKYLRRLKLDELPQLINVLKGEMSLIGPRPEVADFVNIDDVLWQRILQVRPGITDVATLCFRNEEQILRCAGNPELIYRSEILPIKLKLNLHYLISRTWRADVRLLSLTIRYSLFPGSVDHQEIAKLFNIPDQELRLIRKPVLSNVPGEELGIELEA